MRSRCTGSSRPPISNRSTARRRPSSTRSAPAASCWSWATAAAPRMRSMSPPNWSAGSSGCGGRWRPSRLTADTSVMTSVANDEGYAEVFVRQVEALGRVGDVVLAISTSGRSPNVVAALRRARQLGLKTIALTGGDGGDAGRAVRRACQCPGRERPRGCRRCTARCYTPSVGWSNRRWSNGRASDASRLHSRTVKRSRAPKRWLQPLQETFKDRCPISAPKR